MDDAERKAQIDRLHAWVEKLGESARTTDNSSQLRAIVRLMAAAYSAREELMSREAPPEPVPESEPETDLREFLPDPDARFPRRVRRVGTFDV
jgi:hypothetical protein